jgi:uncharacterized Fe-S cluster-containing radical SAM superfamily enzyme
VFFSSVYFTKQSVKSWKYGKKENMEALDFYDFYEKGTYYENDNTVKPLEKISEDGYIGIQIRGVSYEVRVKCDVNCLLEKLK